MLDVVRLASNVVGVSLKPIQSAREGGTVVRGEGDGKAPMGGVQHHLLSTQVVQVGGSPPSARCVKQAQPGRAPELY